MSAADTPEPGHDVVAEAFARMRAAAQEGGFRLPELQRPAPRRSAWTGMQAPLGQRSATEIVSDVAAQQEARAVAKDRAGSVIPPHLLREPGIRFHFKSVSRMSPIGAVLNREIAERGWQKHIAHGVIMTEWEELVGPTVAEHAAVQEFRDGVLAISCTSTSWATSLRLSQQQILRKIAERVGDGVVEQLQIQGPKAPSWRKGRLNIQGRGPRDTYG